MDNRKTLATVWLDGCSGCHMSFLDIDERLLVLAQKADLVYSPLVDRKDFPDSVDITLVEGAVSSTDDLAKIKKVRAHSKILVSLGDCAVTSNVPAMRNPFGVKSVLERGYAGKPPTSIVPVLLDRCCPVHEIVPVDVFVPGCPPSADTIFQVLTELLEGQPPGVDKHRRFGS